MHGELAAGAEDDPFVWRRELSLRLARTFVFVYGFSALVVWFAVSGPWQRPLMFALTLISALVVAVPAITRRPAGNARSWLILLPAAAMSIAGYALVGFLSGPSVCFTFTLMLAGLLLGRRAMIAVLAGSGLVLTVVVWAIVSGRIPAPYAPDVSTTNPIAWVRSLSVTFMAAGLFGGMMLAIVTRMERSLQRARSETLRREQAERARAEAELVTLEAKQMETIGRLAAGVAHDFNNHLTSIMASAELLRLEQPEQQGIDELVEGILTSSQRLAELTRQLLAYSRKATMVRTTLALHATIEEAVSMLRRSTDPNVEIVTELTAQTYTVLADSALLQSAILNLLVNARDAMKAGGILTIRTWNPGLSDGAGAQPSIAIEVRDTGSGIAKDVLGNIFDPFFTTKPVGGGTGLGLASVAGTIRAHGGVISVESEVGIGTVFLISLPCTRPEVTVPVAEPDATVAGRGEVLLVEDDAMVSVAAARTLESLGYRVTRASDGKRALELVDGAAERFQLVLLDLRMPGLSGEATFDALQRLAPRLPILLWSGYGADQDVSGMLRRGAAGFVQKPYGIAELSRAVADAIRDRPSAAFQRS
jgi:signal transduction histidine kinase/CheY-like chemotaxis protein